MRKWNDIKFRESLPPMVLFFGHVLAAANSNERKLLFMTTLHDANLVTLYLKPGNSEGNAWQGFVDPERAHIHRIGWICKDRGTPRTSHTSIATT